MLKALERIVPTLKKMKFRGRDISNSVSLYRRMYCTKAYVNGAMRIHRRATQVFC